MKKRSPMKSKQNATYARKSFVQMKIMKMNWNYTKKVRDHCHFTGDFRGAAHNICNLRYKVLHNAVIHNGSLYDYHFIIKQLPEELKGQFKCLGENTEKYITFSVPIKKSMIVVKQLHKN